MDGSKTEGLEMKVSAGTEGARRATGVSADGAAAPDPEVVAKAKRRRFSAEYRLRILRLADACKAPGELGALLRREGLYSSLLLTWRRQREQGALEVLRARKRGPKPKAVDPRALDPVERQAVLDMLHSERFCDQSPAEVHATLLEEQTYLCAPRTMYRLLKQAHEVRERRDQLRHPHYTKPELVATGPNQVWSWDITKLKGPIKWAYFHLYVILDIFSRNVVGWLIARSESARLAERLIEETSA